MDTASIAAVSTSMHMDQVMQGVSVAMTKEIMNLQQTQAAAVVEGLQQAVPSFGHQLDVLA